MNRKLIIKNLGPIDIIAYIGAPCMILFLLTGIGCLFDFLFPAEKERLFLLLFSLPAIMVCFPWIIWGIVQLKRISFNLNALKTNPIGRKVTIFPQNESFGMENVTCEILDHTHLHLLLKISTPIPINELEYFSVVTSSREFDREGLEKAIEKETPLFCAMFIPKKLNKLDKFTWEKFKTESLTCFVDIKLMDNDDPLKKSSEMKMEKD